MHASREDKKRCRDLNDIKLVKERPGHLVTSWEVKKPNNESSKRYNEFDIEASWQTFQNNNAAEPEPQSCYDSAERPQDNEADAIESQSSDSALTQNSADFEQANELHSNSSCKVPASFPLPEPSSSSLSGEELGGGAISSGEVCAICQAQIFQEGGLCSNCSTGLSGNRTH